MHPSLVGGFHPNPEPTSSLFQVRGLPTLPDPADLIEGKSPARALEPFKGFWNAQKHATCINTNHFWNCAISALVLVFLYTGGI